jgi:competence protein ComEC
MLKVVVWDVQQGLAIYLGAPSWHVVVDLGVGSYSKEETFSPLLYLKSQGITQLNSFIVTHPHRDHLDDIGNFKALNPATLMRPKHLSDEDVYKGNGSNDRAIIEQYLTIGGGYKGDVAKERNPFLAENNGGTDVRCFVPTTCAMSNLNNHSVVTVVAHAGSRLLIPGDNELPSWNELLAQKGFKEAILGTDILIAPHHGRESGFSKELFDVIEPRLTIVSDGDACDTTAVDRYSAHTTGLLVRRRGGGQEHRRCVTTRSDGAVVVTLGRQVDGVTPLIEVAVA